MAAVSRRHLVDAQWAMPIRNLATNPSFETPAGTVEVRRNWIPNSLPTSNYGYARANSATEAFDTDHILVTCSPGTTDSGLNLYSTLAVAAGETWTISCDVEGVVSGSWRFSAQGSGTAGAPDGSSPDIPIAAGETKRISHTVTATATGTVTFFLLRRSASGSETIKVRRTMLENSPVAGDYFDHTTSPDPDLTPAATGTPNTSPTILTAAQPATVICPFDTIRAVSSQRWAASGLRSLRLLRTRPGYAYAAIGPIYGLSGKMITIGITTRAATPTVSPGVLLEEGGTPWRKMALVPPGTTLTGVQHWLATFTVPNPWTGGPITFYPPDGIGESIWYDNYLQVEGVYDGPYRDGDSPGWAWQGLPHQSPSVGYPRP